MKLIRFDNDGFPNRTEYETDNENIRELAMEYGHTRDTLELYTNNGELIAVATWPQGSRVYKFSYGKNLDPNPSWRIFIY